MYRLEINGSQEVKRCPLFLLHRVTTQSGEQVLLKACVTDDGTGGELLKRELATFSRVASPGVATPIALVHVRDRPGACYRDSPGTPLLGRDRFSLSETVDLASGLCAILDDFHAAGLLLLGLGPTSFLSDGAGRLTLVDAPFARASLDADACGEADWIRSPFLPYAAPEAIRALSRPLDGRADLYALGALLYELLSGNPPFASRDPGELIQSHMARQPRPLHELVPDLSTTMASAVMQLLAKNPAERPASTSAFLRSFHPALPNVSIKANTPDDALPPGTRDRPALNVRFHGREAILLDLRASLEESTGSTVTFVQGEPGSGKTALLEELRKVQVGVSCWGKFTRGSTSQPLSGWVALARALADSALSMNAAEFRKRRQRVEEALGGSGPVLVSLAEEWDAVLRCGSGPAEHLEGGLNRAAVALQRLLGSYADPAAPMWVFLDDLQWADASSLRILELILTLPTAPNLRVLASTRLPEPGEDRAELGALQNNLRRSGVDVRVVDLEGLGSADLRALILDAFGPGLDGLDDLIAYVDEKTHGNPFFARELLSALTREGALACTNGRWTWRTTTAAIALPDSLLDLLIRRVHELPADTRALLIAAACIGDGVRRSDLCAATEREPSAVRESLRVLVTAGLIHEHTAPARPDDPSYSFAHERILEASLTVASEEERVALSIRLFHLLGAELPTGDRVLTFTLANLFNAGSAAVESDAERFAGASANQASGVAAKAKGAYAQALHYLEKAVEQLRLMRGSRWSDHPELTRGVYEQAAEAALLCNRFELTTDLCDEVLSHSGTTLERATAQELQIRGLSARKRFGEAVEMALSVQAERNIHFPRNPSMAHVIWGYIWTLRRAKKLGAERLLRLPPREDAEIAAASRLMQTVFAITHFHKPELYPLFVFRQVEQCVNHGNDAYAGQAYSAFSMILAGLGEIDLAHQVITMSLELPSTPAGDKLRCRSLFVYYSFVVPWREPVRDTFPHLDRAAQTALEHGDFEFAGYAVTMRALGQLYTGDGLADLTVGFERDLTQLGALGQERNVIIQSILCEAVHELRHGPTDGLLNGPFYKKAEGLSRCQDPMDHTLVFHHYLAELCVAAHVGDAESARNAVESAQPSLANGAFGSYLLSSFLFYEAWTLGVCASLTGSTPAKAKRRLRRSQKQLSVWAKSAPMNFGSKLHFVRAERWRLSGRVDAALRSYEAAIDEARACGYYHEAALAHERAASLWLERGFSRLAGQHLEDARGLYAHWGALAAAERLTAAHPRQLSLFPARLGVPGAARGPESLDYHALIKASQAISGEILLPRLLERLLETIMEHTGAQRGVLVLERRGELVVEAEADIDRPSVQLIANETVETTERVCPSVVRYVARLEKSVVLAEATEDATFGRDAYVQRQRPRSVLCTPILYRTKLLGIVYLENNRVGHVFTRTRLEMVSLFASQAAISIANARFHALELEAQQAKISPHFLFNALSSIAELATVDGARAETAIVRLAHLYRYILASSVTELVSLERELSIVQDYLNLEKLRYGPKLDFSVTHEGPLEKVRLPGLLIQPLVENSIRHAIAHKLGGGRVWVHARVHDERCTIVVHDDGDGAKHTSTGTGFGLRSVQQRLELVYGSRFSFAISQRGGYRVEIEVPHEAASPPA